MVPMKFEQYLEEKKQRGAHRRECIPKGHCEMCGADGVRLPVDEHCHACLKYEFGYDQAVDQMVTAIIGDAVSAPRRS